ncbi:MAG: NDP-sugar synthase, partial [Chloroflexota bacterium]
PSAQAQRRARPAGKPMIDWVMDGLKSAGLDEFIIVVHPDDRELINFYSSEHKIKIVYQAERKGAAHALLCAANLIHGDFILTACDNLVENEHIQRFIDNFSNQNNGSHKTRLAVIKTARENMKNMGMVTWDGNVITNIIEKPSEENVISDTASIPLYGLPFHFLDYLPMVTPSKRGELELQDGIQRMINEGIPVFGELLPGRKTVTDANDLLKINIEFLRSFPLTYITSPIMNVKFTNPCMIEKGAVIGEYSHIGPDVVIENGAVIGKYCVISHSVLLRNAVIPDGTSINNQIIN